MSITNLNPEFSGLGVEPKIIPKVLSLYEDMPFGKYKGYDVKTAIDTDSMYMQWFSDNVERYLLSPEARNYLRQSIEFDESEGSNESIGIDFGNDDIPW